MVRHVGEIGRVLGPPDTRLPLWMERRVHVPTGKVAIGWYAKCSCGWGSGTVKRKAIAVKQFKDHL